MSDHQTLPKPPGVLAPVRYCAGSFPGRRDQVRLVRGMFAVFFDGCPGADDAILLASELAANAVAHSASGQPGGTLTVRAEVCPGVYLSAEVEDQGSAWDGNISAAEPPHGLFLLRALSADCGIRHGEDGWVTWFTVPSPAIGPGPQP
jgi:hypothetical protein